MSASHPSLLRLNRLFFWLTWAGAISFCIQRGLETKIPASLCFFLLGCINTHYARKVPDRNRPFVFWMLTGLFLGMAGDILLQIHFLAGAATFALGHVGYLAAYCCLLRKEPGDCRCCACIVLPSLALVLFLPVLDFGSGFMQGVVVVYAVIISLMTGKAVSNYRRSPDPVTQLLMIGSILFFFSDFMLLFAFYTDVGRIANILCLNTYYPAQALLASSIYLHANSKEVL